MSWYVRNGKIASAEAVVQQKRPRRKVRVRLYDNSQQAHPDLALQAKPFPVHPMTRVSGS